MTGLVLVVDVVDVVVDVVVVVCRGRTDTTLFG